MSLHQIHTSSTKSNSNEILETRKLVLCDDHLTHMVPISTAQPPETSTFTTITRLTFLQTQDEEVSNTCIQPKYSDIPLGNQNTNCPFQN